MRVGILGAGQSRIAWLAVPLVLLSACATNISPEIGEQFDLGPFLQGKADLPCEYPHFPEVCRIVFADKRNALRSLHDRGEWTVLAREVITARWSNDLAWYYLGRAAEGVGAQDAAAVYYRRSMDPSNWQCARLSQTRQVGIIQVTLKKTYSGDTCDGFVLPRDAAQRFSMISAAQKGGTPSHDDGLNPFLADIQGALRDLGYYDGAIDGAHGPATRKAIVAFRTDMGLSPMGGIDNDLLSALGLGGE